MLRGHYEADDRPDRSMIDGLHYGRALEFGVFLAWAERHPADGNIAVVANQAWWVAGIDKSLQLGTICLGARRSRTQGSARAASAVVHAPAAASHRAPSGTEQRFDVRPTLGREGQDGELHGARLLLTCNDTCIVPACSNGALRTVFFVLRLDRRAGFFPVGVGPGEELVERAAVDEAGGAVDGDGLAGEELAAVRHEEGGEVLQLFHFPCAPHRVDRRGIPARVAAGREALAGAFCRENPRGDGVQANPVA